MDVFTAQRPTPQQRFQTVFDAFSRRDNAAIGRANDLRAASELDENSCKPVNPYPGLRSFTPDEGTVFFGRERSVNEIRNRLADLHVAVVLGGSGSGKSSVVRAGLMPRLNSTKGIRGRPGNWYTAEFRPRTQPMEELIGALAGLLANEFPAEAAGGDTDARARLQATFGCDADTVRKMRAASREARAEHFCDALFTFVDVKLDELDRTATQGLRAGRPNFLLVIDQFEEIFRPEVSADEASGGGELLDLLLNAFARLERETSLKADARSGLFIILTMRSEELHRCTEHPSLAVPLGTETAHRSLADMVNRCAYLLDLLDPAQDRNDLREAIIRPARQVFEDWGLPIDRNNRDAPFAAGVPDWLLRGTQQLSLELEHRPDQLPLLQHALQTMWHAAMEDWSKGGSGDQFTIRHEHLRLRRKDPARARKDAPDLAAVLDFRADLTLSEAVKSFGPTKGRVTPQAAGMAALRAAFRALAQRDDRGNWARRFATVEDIRTFLSADPVTIAYDATRAESGVVEALKLFVRRGYLVDKQGQYDISHEALIRNWRRYQEWLREPDDVAQTLTKILTDLDPRSVEQDTEEAAHQLVYSFPGSVRERLSLLFKARQLPLAWAIDQTLPILRRPTSLERWGTVAPPPREPGLQDERAFAAAVLERIGILAAKAEDAVNRSAARAEQQRNQQRRIKAWGFGALAFAAVAIVGTLLVQDYAAKRGVVERLITFAERDPSPNIRLRILLLLNALDRSQGIANAFIDPGFAERALRRTLARSPVMGGGYQAIGVNTDGTKLALVAGQSLRVHTVDGKTAAGPALPITFPEQDNNAAPPATYRSGFFEPLSAGFLRHPDLGEIPAAYRDGFLTFWIDQRPSFVDVRPLLPEAYAAGNFRLVELAGSLRFTVAQLRTEGRTGRFETHTLEFGLEKAGAEWRLAVVTPDSTVPSAGLRFAPTLSSGCGMYGYLAGTPASPDIQHLFIGVVGKDERVALDLGVARDDVPGSAFAHSIGFSSDCSGVAVRTSPDSVSWIPLNRNGDRIALGKRASFDVPPAARGLLFQLFPRNRPLLAVARMEGNRLRLAWLVPNGVALVETDPGSNAASLPRPGTLVTGLENAVKLQFSRNGDYLTAVQLYWGSSSPGQLRLWDLSGNHALPSERDDLVKEACHVAAQEPGGARFTPEEVDIWFGDKRPVQQPCEKWSP